MPKVAIKKRRTTPLKEGKARKSQWLKGMVSRPNTTVAVRFAVAIRCRSINEE
ncbi:hypothetical protein EVA_21075 [gut metagenome]|uniref:Uncharacterized protein n=1 Tax=gut metagenome TaxID=749906 RepID=J9F8P5_9ZZZZ